jgi:ribokinase
MSQLRPRICVAGSINMDLLVQCQRLPRPGETVTADTLTEVPGGKGANQAVAAARCGGQVAMLGHVGDDGFGEQLLDHLRSEAVDDRFISTVSGPSGIAIVEVERSGENSILVIPGANAKLTVDDVQQAAEAIRRSDVLLLQLETPIEPSLAARKIAIAAGTRVIFDPAPVSTTLPPELFQVDLICPNESEAMALTKQKLESIDQARSVAERLLELGPKAVAITLGPRGTLLHDGSRTELIDTISVDAVDSTAAGDSFAGAVAVRWTETDDLFEAVRFANVAGAITASTLGAQPSIASRERIESAFADRKGTR